MKNLIKATLYSLVLCSLCVSPLPAAELSTSFPKPPIPLELAPRMGRPFTDNAVFQQNMPIPVWGWTLPGSGVYVTFDAEKSYKTISDAEGRFEVTLDPMPADQLKSVDESPPGHTLTIETHHDGKREVKTFSNILIGEVWLCSGQSSMAVKFGNTAYPKNSQSEANYPALRFLDTEWTVSTPKTVGKCYSISFVFARKLQSELLVPIGVMNAAVAGTGIDGWQYIPPGEPPIKTKYQNFIPKIEPLVEHTMRGALWYQGETNVNSGKAPDTDEESTLDYYTWDKDMLRFTRHLIAKGVGTGLFIRSADLDGNGKIDLAVSGKSGTYLLFQK